MSSLRNLIDATTAIINPEAEEEKGFSVNQDVVIRSSVNRSGPSTFEIKAAKIISIEGSMATVTVAGPLGNQLHKTVPLNQLQPATEAMKKKMVQFNSQHARKW